MKVALPFSLHFPTAGRSWMLATLVLISLNTVASSQPADLTVSQPMHAPHWALLQRELLRANSAACEEFFARYFDERGYLQCVERWGGNDGPDDAIENLLHWPVLHALGGSDSVLQLYKLGWEGHLRQYTEAKTTDVPFARDGMYFKKLVARIRSRHCQARGASMC